MAAVVFQNLEVTPQRRAWRRLLRRGGALFGLSVVLFFIAIAILAPWLAPYDPLATSWSAVRAAPEAAHPFGSDELGRDVLSRIIWGARASILAGVVSVSISLALGVPIAIMALVRLGPRKAARAMARIRNGQASIASVMREMSASTQRPR